MAKDKIKARELIDQFISVVVVTDHQSRNLELEVKELSIMLSDGYTNYEIIIVDNKLI